MRHHTPNTSITSNDNRHPLVGNLHVAQLGTCLIIALTACAALASRARGQEPVLPEVFQKLTSLEVGQGLEMLQPIEQAIILARHDETLRQALETNLIAILQGNATDLAKDYACRQLVVVGQDASVPVLAQLLPNARLSYMARYALEGIGSATATQALRGMLANTAGQQQVGVVISLGRLADAGAVPELTALLASDHEELREAVVVALGRIGTAPAGKALQDFANHAPAPLMNVLVDAQLQAAERLCEQGDFQAAIGLCEPLLADDSERVRSAALRRLIASQPTQSLAMITASLAAEESWKRAVAADCVVALQKPDDIESIAAAVGNLPIAGKIAALISLKDHGSPAIRTAALLSLGHNDSAIRTAALETLIASATAEDVPVLARTTTADEDLEVRHAAFETLRLMTADGTNQAIVNLFSEPVTVNPVLVQCALARRNPEFIPSFLKSAESSDAATRLASFQALEIMATENEAAALASLLSRTPAGEEREAANRAVWMSCQKITDPAQRSAPLLAAMQTADGSGQCAILPTLARIGGPQSLIAIHSAMKSDRQAVRDAGYRALANWPDATVADELLEIAKSGELEPYRIWSLRAYARVVTSSPDQRPPQQTFEMLREAMGLATRPQDQELIISRLGSVRVPEALALLLSLLDKEALNDAVVPAIFTLAKGLSQSHPAQAQAALEKIQPLTTDAAILQQIPKVIRDIQDELQNKKQ